LTLCKPPNPTPRFGPCTAEPFFELQDGIAASRIGGVYAYDAHVSVEFAKGASFADPAGLLEGKGKQRRHLKLYTAEDIQTKTVQHFLDQAINTYKKTP